MDLLTQHPGWKFVITDHVVAEVSDDAQQTALAHALSNGHFELVSITEQPELKRFAELNNYLGKGESAAIAVAETRGFLVAMDEGGKARRTVQEGPCKDRLITTPGILLDLIKRKMFTVAEADELKSQLETMRFKMSFNSFADLI
ncbi:MAG TPA: hypothetical protein V6C97_22480 [Oculatellaceae cyanobacterium]